MILLRATDVQRQRDQYDDANKSLLVTHTAPSETMLYSIQYTKVLMITTNDRVTVNVHNSVKRMRHSRPTYYGLRLITIFNSVDMLQAVDFW